MNNHRNRDLNANRNSNGDFARRYLYNMGFPALLLLSIAACNRSPANGPSTSNQANAVAQSNQSSPPVQNTLDKGDLKLSYKPRKSFRPGTTTIATNPQVLSQIISNLNEKISLLRTAVRPLSPCFVARKNCMCR